MDVGSPRPGQQGWLTLDLIVGRQEADVGEGDPPRVPVIELHGDQVPVILEAEQACGQRGRVREASGPHSLRGTRGAETSR